MTAEKQRQPCGGQLRRAAEHRLGRQGAAAQRCAGYGQRRGHASHRGRRRPPDAGGGGGKAEPPRAGYHHHAVWTGGRQRADPEGGGRPTGHLPVLHLPAGKAHHPAAPQGDPAHELKKAVKAIAFTAFCCQVIAGTGRRDG